MRDVSLTKLAEALNKNFNYTFTQSNLSRKLNSDTVRWSELRDIAKVLGYSIKISPIESWEGIDAKNTRTAADTNITTIL